MSCRFSGSGFPSAAVAARRQENMERRPRCADASRGGTREPDRQGHSARARSLGGLFGNGRRRGSSCFAWPPQYTRTRVRRARSKRPPQKPRATPLSVHRRTEGELDSPAFSSASDSQCLEASWRTGGAPAVAAQSPGVFRRACVSPTQIFFSTSRKARAERRRESGRRPPVRRGTHRETRDTGSPRHRWVAGEAHSSSSPPSGGRGITKPLSRTPRLVYKQCVSIRPRFLFEYG